MGGRGGEMRFCTQFLRLGFCFITPDSADGTQSLVLLDKNYTKSLNINKWSE
jgi:hypothetical protein